MRVTLICIICLVVLSETVLSISRTHRDTTDVDKSDLEAVSALKRLQHDLQKSEKSRGLATVAKLSLQSSTAKRIQIGFDDIKKFLLERVKDLTDWVAKEMAPLVNIGQKFSAILQKFKTAVWTFMSDNFCKPKSSPCVFEVQPSFVNQFKAIADAVKAAIEKAIQKAKDKLNDLWNLAKDVGKKMLATAAGAAKAVGNAAVKTYDTIKDDAGNALTNIKSFFGWNFRELVALEMAASTMRGSKETARQKAMLQEVRRILIQHDLISSPEDRELKEDSPLTKLVSAFVEIQEVARLHEQGLLSADEANSMRINALNAVHGGPTPVRPGVAPKPKPAAAAKPATIPVAPLPGGPVLPLLTKDQQKRAIDEFVKKVKDAVTGVTRLPKVVFRIPDMWIPGISGQFGPALGGFEVTMDYYKKQVAHWLYIGPTVGLSVASAGFALYSSVGWKGLPNGATRNKPLKEAYKDWFLGASGSISLKVIPISIGGVLAIGANGPTIGDIIDCGKKMDKGTCSWAELLVKLVPMPGDDPVFTAGVSVGAGTSPLPVGLDVSATWYWPIPYLDDDCSKNSLPDVCMFAHTVLAAFLMGGPTLFSTHGAIGLTVWLANKL